ncbi:MAG: hypothetical protein ACOZIN_03995 [Myxococcota bacterium]
MRPTFCALLLLSCSPPERGCADGGECTTLATDGGGICKGDGVASPPNLLDNPGFECGAPSGWFAQNGTLTAETAIVHGGAQAAKLTASAGSAASLWHEADAVQNPANRTYCARAWMRGTAANGRITVRKVATGGGVDENFSSPLSNTSWTLVPPASYGPLKVVGSGEERFLLRIWIPSPNAGEVLWVDDVELWHSANGTCSER